MPLTGATRNICSTARAIARMKRGAILINAARGGVLDEAAVADALRAARSAAPRSTCSNRSRCRKSAGQVFAGCPNLILTPHIAGLTVESNTRVSQLVAEKIRDHLAGGR